MDTIHIERSFILSCNCSVTYDGRAKSTLIPGNYVIIHKSDGTLLIHGDSLFKPLNFQPPGAIMRKYGNKLISTRKNETITIDIISISNYYEPIEWSDNKIKLTGSESDMRSNFISNILYKHFTKGSQDEIFIEYKTPVGSIDLLLVQNQIYTVFEFKRKKANLSGCTQLLRYVDYFKSVNICCNGILVSPSITDNALKYLINSECVHIVDQI